jgi:hypothetical protein
MTDDTCPPAGATRPAEHLTADQVQAGAVHVRRRACHAVTRDPVPLAEAVAELVDVSDLLDVHLRLRLAAFAEGYAAAELEHADDFERGFASGCMSVKRAQHDAHGLVEHDARRWSLRGEPRTRQTFACVHPDDYRGGAA